MDHALSTLIMLGLVSLLIILHELGHFWVAKKCGIRVERFGMGLPFGPTLWSKKFGDTEYCLHAALFGGYVAFADDNPDSDIPKDSPERFENAGWWERFAVAIAGIVVNAIVGVALMFSVAMVWGMPGIEGIKIMGLVDTMTIAQDAGLQAGDTIVAVDNHRLSDNPPHKRMGLVLDTIKQHANMALPLTVERTISTVPDDATVEPGEALPKDQQAASAFDKGASDALTQEIKLVATPNDKGMLGIKLAPTGGATTTYSNPVTAMQDSVAFLSGFVVQNFQALGGLMTGQISGDQLSGPIRIIEQGGKVIHDQGIQNGLVIASILSVILAVMNLLPIPALDGGHILFLMIEALKGSPVNKRFQETVTQLGFAVLLLLMGFVFANDIWQLIVH